MQIGRLQLACSGSIGFSRVLRRWERGRKRAEEEEERDVGSGEALGVARLRPSGSLVRARGGAGWAGVGGCGDGGGV